MKKRWVFNISETEIEPIGEKLDECVASAAERVGVGCVKYFEIDEMY